MNKIHEEIKELNKAGAFGMTEIKRILNDGTDGVSVYVAGICYTRALEKLQDIAREHNKNVFITLARCRDEEIRLRMI